jgi:mono/diheme cytochrome c family protein
MNSSTAKSGNGLRTLTHHVNGRMHVRWAGPLLVAALMTPHGLAAQEYPPDVSRGKAVYERHCQSCHGVAGWGDGPAGESLKVRPTDFHRLRSMMKSDDELLRTIEHGVVFSPMHSWRGQLTDGEMQDVVAYIRLLSQQGR